MPAGPDIQICLALSRSAKMKKNKSSITKKDWGGIPFLLTLYSR